MPSPPDQQSGDDAPAPERGAYDMIDLDLDEKIRLPFLSIVFMTVGNVRNRLGRSVVTLFGVVLGTAFLMSVGSGGLVRETLSDQEANRTNAANAVANMGAELGALRGRTLGVIIETWDDYTMRLVERLAGEPEITLQVFAPDTPEAQAYGKPADSRAKAVEYADALVVCNYQAEAGGPIPDEAGQLKEKIVMDLQGLYGKQQLAGKGLRYSHITHTDTAGLTELSESEPTAADQKARTGWLIGVSLLVSGIGIANALLMSVTERFQEIGTLKCLGSRDTLVVELFIIESGVLGLVGSLIGAVAGLLIAIGSNALTYGWEPVWTNLPWRSLLGFGLLSLVVGLVVAMAAAIYPAFVAARMTPADALRSEV